ncbi:MAG: alkaline phosphatase [Planctomycetota bacterium]|jgi:alkaline phosphatase
MRAQRFPFTLLAVLSAFALLLAVSAKGGEKPKYVFYFIGDGMGPAQVHAAEAYLGALQSDDTKPGGPKTQLLEMSKLGVHGMCTTHSWNRLITDSAAAGTALACGKKTNGGVVAMGPDRRTALPTVAERAKAMGMAVAVISSVSIDHATPACFYSHAPNRGMYHQICLQLAASDFDFFGGGGMKGQVRKGVDAKKLAMEKGFVFADTFEDLKKIGPNKRILAWNRARAYGEALHYDLDRLWLAENGKDDAERKQMSLADYTAEAARRLKGREKGFFMMVEGGKIDWACHANDGMAAILDVLALDEAVKEALKFFSEHPKETLILVTADHETGGMTLGYAGSGSSSAFEILKNQKMSAELFVTRFLAPYVKAYDFEHPGRRKAWKDDEYDMDAEMISLIRDHLGLDIEEKDRKKPAYMTAGQKAQLEGAYDRTMSQVKVTDPVLKERYRVLYGSYVPVALAANRILNRKAGLSFSTFSHTASPVPVMAMGAGAERFSGFYDNTEIPKRLAEAMGIDFG